MKISYPVIRCAKLRNKEDKKKNKTTTENKAAVNAESSLVQLSPWYRTTSRIYRISCHYIQICTYFSNDSQKHKSGQQQQNIYIKKKMKNCQQQKFTFNSLSNTQQPCLVFPPLGVDHVCQCVHISSCCIILTVRCNAEKIKKT